MRLKRLSLQGAAGFIAILAIGFVAIAPLVGAMNAAFETRAELKERKTTADLLATRMDEERREMMRSPDLYARSDALPDATVLNETLSLTCERVVQSLQSSGGNAGCSYSSSPIGDVLARQDATLTASGDMAALLAALDTIDPETSISHLSITSGLKQNAVIMELRLHGLSKQAEMNE